MDLRGKRVLVMGLGLQGSGIAAARYAAQQGAIVRVTDMKSPEILAPSVRALAGLPIEFVLGEHRSEDFLWAEIVIRNPGVPLTSPYLQLAGQHGARIEMEIALFFLACPARIIGVTGTRGKTTTSTLLNKIIQDSGVTTVLEGLAPHRISPPVAVMTNIYPDHLNTYTGMEDYAAAKATIFRYQHPTDIAVFNYDNPWTHRFGEEAPSNVWFTSLKRGGSFERGSTTMMPFPFTETPLVGKHY